MSVLENLGVLGVVAVDGTSQPFSKILPAFKWMNSFSQCPALFYQFSAGHILA
jgi:hypothetical protein